MPFSKHMRKGSSKLSKLHKLSHIIRAIYEVTEILKTIMNLFH